MSLVAEMSALASAATSVIARRLGFYALIGALLTLSLGFAVAAGWSALSGLYGPVIASLAIAGGAMTLALLVGFADLLARRSRKRRAERLVAQKPTQPPMSPLLMQTFIAAMQVGRSMRG